MSRRRSHSRNRRYRSQPHGRRYGRRRSQPNMFWGRALTVIVVLFCIWAWSKGQQT